mmetsp:Transcript_16794/g.49416  ORF Transcript_16794/g.49416 Transcript_16794/m.49416 type:complete len:242 (-) Transcript_16794:208-933(-)
MLADQVDVLLQKLVALLVPGQHPKVLDLLAEAPKVVREVGGLVFRFDFHLFGTIDQSTVVLVLGNVINIPRRVLLLPLPQLTLSRLEFGLLLLHLGHLTLESLDLGRRPLCCSIFATLEYVDFLLQFPRCKTAVPTRCVSRCRAHKQGTPRVHHLSSPGASTEHSFSRLHPSCPPLSSSWQSMRCDQSVVGRQFTSAMVGVSRRERQSSTRTPHIPFPKHPTGRPVAPALGLSLTEPRGAT